MARIVPLKGEESRITRTQKLKDSVHEYRTIGWKVIPVKDKGKFPIGSDWQKGATSTAENWEHQIGFGPCNIGLLLGKEVIDIDLDCKEALHFAPLFLPNTLTFGRKSSPSSHYLYLLSPSIGDAQKMDFSWPKSLGVEEDHATIVELRGTNASGSPTQTVIPPSIHVSGEPITWDSDLTEIREISTLKTVEKGVRYLAIACMLSRIWQTSNRETLAGALTGWLLKRGEDAEAVTDLIDYVITYVGDEERISRLHFVKNTVAKFDNKTEISGTKALEQELGKDLVEWLAKTLGDSSLKLMGFDIPSFKEIQYKNLPKLGLEENYRLLIYLQNHNRYARITGGNVDREPAFFDRQHVGNAYSNQLGKDASAIIHKSVPQVSTLSYCPGESIITTDQETGDDVLNTWRAPLITPAESINEEDIQLFKNHILALCKGRKREANLFEGWLAYLVQKNAQRCTWGILLVGGEGTGKGSLLTIMKKILGISNVVSRTADLALKDETFNGWMASKRLVAIEEIDVSTRAYKTKLGNTIKEWITEDTFLVRKMRQEPITFPNYAQFFFTTNHDNAIHITEGNRRLMVIRDEKSMYSKSSHQVRKENNHWLKDGYYHKWLEEEGPSQIYRYLLDLDLDKIEEFDPYMAPMTTDKMELTEGTQLESYHRISDAIEAHDGPFVKDLVRTKDISIWLKEIFGRKPLESEIVETLKSLKATHLKQHECRKKVDGKNRQFVTWCIRDWDKYENMRPSKRFDYFHSMDNEEF